MTDVQAERTSARQTVCNGRYEVRLDDPLPDLDGPGGKAYNVTSLRGGSAGGASYAFVPHRDMLPRAESFGNALNVNTPNVIRFIDHDVLFNVHTRRHHPVVLLERPMGVRLIGSPHEERTPVNADIPFRQLVESLHDAMRDMHLAGAFHGCVNPSNMYQREAGMQVQLGDYLSAPAGVNQWDACETIERQMADPAGRGPPTAADDMYAIGASLLILMLGRLPAHHLLPQELLIAKIEKGSMMALLGGAKLPSAFSEIIRGLMMDDPRQRWSLDDLQHWLGGRRLGNKSAGTLKKAQRTLEFGKGAYLNVRTLTHAMSKDVEAAARLIEDGSLDRWLRRSLMDEELANLIADTVAASTVYTKGGTPAERLVARVCITLDPMAPIRFRDTAVLPYGLGTRMAQRFLAGQTPKDVPDILLAQLITHWSQQQLLQGIDATSVQQTYEGARILLERSMHGFGLERILYEMNPSLPCLSPMIERYYAVTPKTVLESMEREVAEHPDENDREPMDRHIAAYLLARLKRMNDRFFSLLAADSQPSQRAIAILSILADAQRKASVNELPALAERLAHLVEPAMDRFHNNMLRDKVLRDLRRSAKRGRLDEMVAIIDDGSTISKDEEGFRAARAEYQHWERQARALAIDPAIRERELTHQGRQITSFIALFVAMIVMLGAIFMKVMH